MREFWSVSIFIFFFDFLIDILTKAVVLDWPLNIYTNNGCQKEFPQDIPYVKFYSPKLLDFKTLNFHGSQWGCINFFTLEMVKCVSYTNKLYWCISLACW